MANLTHCVECLKILNNIRIFNGLFLIEPIGINNGSSSVLPDWASFGHV